MRSILFISAAHLLIAILMTGCSGEKDKKSTRESSDYIEQPLQGKIGGKDWKFAAGRADSNDFDSTLSFTLISGAPKSICEDFMLEAEDKLSVRFGADEEELKVERYPLGMDSGKTVTLVEMSEEENSNLIVLDGYYEFTEVAVNKVEGKMVANDGTDNSVTGSFEVVRCCKD